MRFEARGEREEGEEERLEPYLSSGDVSGLYFPTSTIMRSRGFNGENSREKRGRTWCSSWLAMEEEGKVL